MKATNDLLRSVAVIGCGALVEEVYADALAGLAGCGWNLFFVDTNTARAASLAERFTNAKVLASVSDVVSHARYAIVATPPATHYAICSKLLDGNIHVLCEKPFVLDPHEGRVLVQRATLAGVKLQVNQTRRWFRPLWRLNK